MIKKLTKHGNSMALVIDKPIMESLGLSADTPLQIVVSGNSLVVSWADVGIGSDRLKQHTSAIRKRYGNALKRLAK